MVYVFMTWFEHNNIQLFTYFYIYEFHTHQVYILYYMICILTRHVVCASSVQCAECTYDTKIMYRQSGFVILARTHTYAQ